MPRRKRKIRARIANLQKKRKGEDQLGGLIATRNEENAKSRVDHSLPQMTPTSLDALQDIPPRVQLEGVCIDPCIPQHIRSALNHWFGGPEEGEQTHPAAMFFWDPLDLQVRDIISTGSIAHEEALEKFLSHSVI